MLAAALSFTGAQLVRRLRVGRSKGRSLAAYVWDERWLVMGGSVNSEMALMEPLPA